MFLSAKKSIFGESKKPATLETQDEPVTDTATPSDGVGSDDEDIYI